MTQLFVAPILACLITVLSVPFVIKFAKKTNLMDDPKTHKHPAILHKKPIPRAGGLAIFIGIFIAALIFMPFDNFIKIYLALG